MAESTFWKRTRKQEIDLRCKMKEGTFLWEAAEHVVKLLGEERAGRQVPISGASNVLRRMLNVTAILYDLCGATGPDGPKGLDPDFVGLLSDSSAYTQRDTFAKIKAVPMPSGLVEGGGRGGLRDNLEYLQAIGYSGVAIDWSTRSERPFIAVAKPCDFEVFYLADDPLAPARVEWNRERKVEGKVVFVTDVWDLSDLDNPRFFVLDADRQEITAKVDALAEAHAKGFFEGASYWWRYTSGARAGRAYMPFVVYGNPSRVMDSLALTEATLDAVAFRTSTKSSVIDSGFPTREVEGLTTGTEKDKETGQEGSSQGPGDVRVWRRVNELEAGTHWEFSATGDPKSLFEVCMMLEADAAMQIGFPLQLTNTGGDPLEHEVEAQRRAIRRWYNVVRAGDALLLRRLAAVTNKRTGSVFAEEGYSALYLDEVEAALAAATAPKTTPAKGDPLTTEEPEKGEEE